MTEIQPGLHQMQELLGDRYLFMYLLTGERSMLIDNGIATSPDATTCSSREQVAL